jgi:hypothetical protein
MSIFKVAAVAVTLAGGAVALAPGAAQAQGYGYGYGHHQGYNQGYYRQAPVYVPPRVARKQAQLSHRFVQKYGYVQPQPHYGYGRQYYNGYGYQQPQVHSYQFGW